jgi:heme exporter protein CcmD
LTEFFDMGGYAWFVWPSYLVTFVIVLLNVYWARRIHRRARDDARRRLATGERA